MMRQTRVAALCLAVAVLLPVLSGCDGFLLQQYVPDESGFDGAVRKHKVAMDGNYGIVWAKVPYLDLEGQQRVGLAQMYVHRKYFTAKHPLPALFHGHYAVDETLAKAWCDRGWAVFSPLNTDSDGAYPLDAAPGNSYNLNRAIIQWIRRLPNTDRSRLHLDGVSQGGYMCLAMSADMFPVSSATADYPVVNWTYNLTYLEANRNLAYNIYGCAYSPMPSLCSVLHVPVLSFAHFGNDLSSDTWVMISPISWLDRIANPVLVTAATGDMLTPINQMSRVNVLEHDPSIFPAGYIRNFDALTLNEAAKITFEEALTPGTFNINVLVSNQNQTTVQDKPWVAGAQWNLLYLNEGPPLPAAGHTALVWGLFPESYVGHYKNNTPSTAILNAAKLLHLMERYELNLSDAPPLANGSPGNRLNFPVLERLDAVRGLLDYAALGATHQTRLITLYRNCPIQPFGAELTIDALQQAYNALLKAL